MSSVPIGRPIWNTRVYVLDEALEPVGIGVAGELFISGAGLARGYLGRPGLTSERFIADPFGEPGARMYRTGDLARWRPDGVLDFLGRIDEQVKIRGFRIEPGEIEAALCAHPSIASAAVIAREDEPDDRRLVAYIVANTEDALPGVGELRTFLSRTLPDHMLPAFIVPLASLPLTPSGKLDRRALPAPALVRDEGTAFRAPQGPVEEALARLMADLLGLDRVGADDNFFELGGDSIKSLQLVSRARSEGLDLSPRQVFEHQTIAGLAHVALPLGLEGPVAEPAEGTVPLTPIQHWFFEQPGPVDHFNQSVLLVTPADLDPDRLERAVQSLVAHHDMLRTIYTRSEEGWVQRVRSSQTIALERYPLSTLASMVDAVQANLSLENGCLVRVAWFEGAEGQEGRLLIVMHHLIVDGVSWRILLEDLLSAYRQSERSSQISLPARTTSFKQWALALRERSTHPDVLAQFGFWRECASSAGELPLDGPASCDNLVSDSARSELVLSAEQTRQLLTQASAAYHSRIDDILLTALAVSLAAWRRAYGSQERCAFVALEGHGREDVFAHTDVSRTVGWFTTQYPARLDIGDVDLEAVMAGGVDAGRALIRIKEQMRAIPNRGLGYGLLRYLNADTGPVLEALPRPGLVFNYLGQFDLPQMGLDGFAFATERAGAARSEARRRDHAIEVNALVVRGEAPDRMDLVP